jgi:tripartite-type tricarboxylate transporter receptor subunit TctC
MKKFLFHFAVLALSCVIIGFTVSSTFAQSYPNKPIRMIVPFAPGGDSDIIARIIAEKLTKSLGQQVLVENKPGADGAIAVEMVAKAVPDGYTLLLGTVGTLAVAPALYKKVRYDSVKDFEPITELIFSPFVLLVNTSVPVRSVKELIALAKSKPGQLNYASGSTIFYLSTEIFKLMTGANIVYIPYKGVAPSMTALVGGEVSMMFTAVIMGFSQVKAGNARALAICTKKRSPDIPDVPTMAESGFPFEAGAWFGVLAPAGTPKEITKRLNTEIVRILNSPAATDQLSKIGDVVASTPEQFAAYIKAEREKYAKVIKDAGIPQID